MKDLFEDMIQVEFEIQSHQKLIFNVKERFL
jgi:hypothetical protein